MKFRDGELDIVAQDGATIVFAEVRLRSSDRFGGAAASVDRFKQRRLTRAAQRYLARSFGPGGVPGSRSAAWPPCRFDVFAVDGDGGLEWIRDAFSES